MRSCCKCHKKIYDRFYVLAENKTFHFDCFCCDKCLINLAGNGTYFLKDGMFLCKSDYYRMTAVCSTCNNTVAPDAYVHKIKLPCLPMQNSINERNNAFIYYHPSCLKCFKCQNFLRKGDKFVVKPDHLGIVCLNNECANDYRPINTTINQTVPNVRKRGRQTQSNASSVKVKSEKASLQNQFNQM